MKREIWRPITGYPEYMVSNHGRVKHLAHYKLTKGRGKKYVKIWIEELILKASPNPGTGYPEVHLYDNYRRKTCSVHVLVAVAFIGPKPSPFHTVDHDDGVRHHNYDDNLKWATHSEQRETARRLGTLPVGEKHYMSFLTDSEIEEIRKRYVPNCRVNGGAAIAREYGCDRSTINKIMAGTNR